MKYLVENKPRTEEDNEIRMNPRCPALLHNHLPPKEQDPGSFILSCSIGKLDFKNALADLGASISIMPFSMYKCLGIGKLKPINMLLEMAHNTKCAPTGIVKNLLIKIDKFIFPVDFVILDKASCNPSSNICDGGDLPINIEKHYWESNNDSKREELEWENLSLNDLMRIRYGKVCKMTGERILKDYWRERFGDEEDDLEENLEDPEECGEDKANTILGVIHDKLNNNWFNNTSEDEDDLEGILDYLKPISYDGFIDFDD
ncbi:reverse transcriptase domain-containing protein [Tanacetum coccineum]